MRVKVIEPHKWHDTAPEITKDSLMDVLYDSIIIGESINTYTGIINDKIQTIPRDKCEVIMDK